MSFFSFLTADTNVSIKNRYSQDGATIVKLIWFDGDKLQEVIETQYCGYGVFGGIDYFSLIDSLNGGTGARERGISLWSQYTREDILKTELESAKNNINFPRLVSHKWCGGMDAFKSLSLNRFCPQRGYYYGRLAWVYEEPSFMK